MPLEEIVPCKGWAWRLWVLWHRVRKEPAPLHMPHAVQVLLLGAFCLLLDMPCNVAGPRLGSAVDKQPPEAWTGATGTYGAQTAAGSQSCLRR